MKLTIKEMDRAVNECAECKHLREIADSTHIRCAMPDWSMAGDPYGVMRGYFAYPLDFDPVWKQRLCKNFTARDSASEQAKEVGGA